MRIICVFIVVFFLLVNCSKKNDSGKNETYPPDTISIHYDYSRIYEYRRDFNPSQFTEVVENKYSRLFIISGTITDSEVTRLSANIDTVINRICVYFNTDVKKEYHGFEGKVSYFIEQQGVIPRVYGGSSIPIVSIPNDNSLLSMYANETVHIFSMNTSSLWLIEGLAVHLADTLGVENLWPNYSADLHLHAKKFINNQESLNYIGIAGFFYVDPTTSTGEAFYSLSGSFVRYLNHHIGKSGFMNCYSSYDFKSSIFHATNKSFDAWKNA